MNPKTKPSKEFIARLKAVADFMTHQQMADSMGVPIWQVRNWLYRDRPSTFAIQALGPVLEALHRQKPTKKA